MKAKDGIQQIDSEEEDLYSSPSHFEVVTYPTDWSLEVIVNKMNSGRIKVRGFQRKYVWSIKQASKLIESFLMGLPVPAVFLYNAPESNEQTVIDGQQRLKSVRFFFEGYFGPPNKRGSRTEFRLKGLAPESPFANITYAELAEKHPQFFNRLNDSVMRAFIVKQLKPNNDTSIYHIFERLNTGGTQLVGQEVRNCVYHGRFNDLLNELNRNQTWRAIFGKRDEDKRMRDVELILRFFALYYNRKSYKKPMKEFLSVFMAENQNPSEEAIANHTKIFSATMDSIHSTLGDKPFHVFAGFNAAIFDSVAIAYADNVNMTPKSMRRNFLKLVDNKKYIGYVSGATTDNEIVTRRLELANEVLFK